MCETIAPPACIAITPPAPFGVLSRPSLLLLEFLGSALPSLFLGRDFLPKTLLPRIALNCLPPDEQATVSGRMRPFGASQLRAILPSLVRVSPARLNVPLLIVGAVEDRLTPVTLTRAIARRYHADDREYPRAGHFVLWEAGGRRMASDMLSWMNCRLHGGTTDVLDGHGLDCHRPPQDN